MDIICAIVFILLVFIAEMRYSMAQMNCCVLRCCVHSLLGLMEFVGEWLVAQNKMQEDNVTDQKIISFVCLALGVALAYIIISLLMSLPLVGYLFMLFLAYAAFGTGSLLYTHKKALADVENASLEGAQHSITRLLGYEISGLDKDGMRKILAERLAQNIPTFIIAPFFWFMVGLTSSIECAVLSVWVYTIVRIAAEKWAYGSNLHLGYGADKVLFIMTYIPARLGAFIMCGVNFISQIGFNYGGHWPGFLCVCIQARGVKNTNIGWSLASVAWLLNAGLGGSVASSKECESQKCFGPSQCLPWTQKKIQGIEKQVRCTSYASLAVLFVLSLIF